jgi:hypothetical protein
VVIGVAGESIFGIRAWWNNRKLHSVQESIDELRQAETSRFNKQAAEANKDAGLAQKAAGEANERAAKAEKQAAEAKLELEKLKTPRSLSAEQQKRVSEKLGVFAGKQFDVALNVEPEPQNLLLQIEDALKAAGWIEIDWKGGSSDVNFTRKGRPVAGIVAVSRVLIQMHPEQISQFGAAAQSVAAALNAEGIAAEAQGGLGTNNINAQAIHILIGRKPQ